MLREPTRQKLIDGTSEGFIDPDRGETLRKELNRLALRHYIPQHTPQQYLSFLNRHMCDFEELSNQSQTPYYMSVFCVASQRVPGDCVEECLDRAMERIR